MWVRLLPLCSRLAEEKELPPELRARLPSCWKLSKHQVETYRALTESDAEVIFNTAMTGDGKSLAGQLPALIRGGMEHPVLAMYPTNELVEDQLVHLGQTVAQWGADIQYRMLNSLELDHLMIEEDYMRRGDALMRILRNGDFILSNPDIFHYVMHQFYTYPEDAPDRYAAPLAQKFRQLTFDEFHIFDASQIVSVLNALLFIQEISGEVRPHKFLFLSATPNRLMHEYLERSGLQVKFIEGEYATEGDPARWRKILNPAVIHFAASARAEEWVEAHLNDILLPFFLERRPHAKGAMIVNSVASALRIYEKLQPVFAEHGLQVELNTGLTSRTRRKISYQADLLIGTSTVDVGVDFQINFLVFESRDAGSFLQRLGRLGRHDSYDREGQRYAFQDYVAYALLPEWMIERLFKAQEGGKPLLEEGAEIERQQFNEAIQSVFPPLAEFEQYAQTWGKFQSLKILQGLARKTVREQYRQSRQNLQKRYEATFGIRLSSAIPHYKELAEKQKPLLEEALSFRGGSPFTCGVIDLTEEKEEDRFKVMDLLQAIANHTLSYLSEAEFYEAARRAGVNLLLFKKQEPLGFFRLHGTGEFQKLRFWLDKDLSYWSAENFGKVQVMKGFSLEANFPGANEINTRLARRTLPALICAGLHPLEMKRRLSLPMLFPLYEFVSRDGVSGTVAFGRTALMLDTRLRYHPLSCGGGAIIV